MWTIAFLILEIVECENVMYWTCLKHSCFNCSIFQYSKLVSVDVLTK